MRLFDLAIFVGSPLIICFVANAVAAPAPLTPLATGLDASAYAGQFQSTVFASGLSFPTSMQPHAGGILVGSTQGGGFYSPSSNGHLLLLTDVDHDGVSDQSLDLTPANGLPGGISSVRRAGDLLLVLSAAGTPTINVLRNGPTPTSPFESVGKIEIGFSTSGWMHRSYALAAHPSNNGDFDLYFNVGARGNDTSDAGNFASHHATLNSNGFVTGLSNVTIDPESIYRMTINDEGSSVSLDGLAKIAGGLRNAAGIAVHPQTNDLYFQDNGMDGNSQNGHPPDLFGNTAYSLDTLHQISESDIGVNLPDGNFATDFFENTRPTPSIHGDPDALTAFAPLGPFVPPDQRSLNESEGASEIAFAPDAFKSILGDGVFIGFHGQGRIGAPDINAAIGNEENPVIFYSFDTGTYWHFIGTAEQAVGHLDGLLSTPDALFLSDIAAGSMSGPSAAGAIYRIAAIPEPSVVGLFALVAVGLVRRRNVES